MTDIRNFEKRMIIPRPAWAKSAAPKWFEPNTLRKRLQSSQPQLRSQYVLLLEQVCLEARDGLGVAYKRTAFYARLFECCPRTMELRYDLLEQAGFIWGTARNEDIIYYVNWELLGLKTPEVSIAKPRQSKIAKRLPIAKRLETPPHHRKMSLVVNSAEQEQSQQAELSESGAQLELPPPHLAHAVAGESP
jgi:hypothetical protein